MDRSVLGRGAEDVSYEDRAFNVIEEPIIRVELTSGVRERSTLPQVFAALLADRVETWPALRPHQASAWHTFLVQIAAMGLEALGRTEPPGRRRGRLVRGPASADPGLAGRRAVVPRDTTRMSGTSSGAGTGD